MGLRFGGLGLHPSLTMHVQLLLHPFAHLVLPLHTSSPCSLWENHWENGTLVLALTRDKFNLQSIVDTTSSLAPHVQAPYGSTADSAKLDTLIVICHALS